MGHKDAWDGDGLFAFYAWGAALIFLAAGMMLDRLLVWWFQ